MKPLCFFVISICIIFCCYAFANSGMPRIPTKFSQMASIPDETTFVMIKPDSVKQRLVGQIVRRFEKKGLSLLALELIHPSQELLEKHYEEQTGKEFFPSMVAGMRSGPVVGMVWSGPRAVHAARQLIGSTDPLVAQPGTIRGDFALLTESNACHGSDSVTSAQREISLWFPHVHKLIEAAKNDADASVSQKI